MALGLLVLFLGASVYGAATTPGNQNFKAKWADWLRSHHAAFVVNPLEQWYYTSQAPAKGGAPKALNRIPAASADPVAIAAAPAGLPAPGPVSLVVSPALPGEGQWQPTGPIVDGRAAMYVAQFRATPPAPARSPQRCGSTPPG